MKAREVHRGVGSCATVFLVSVLLVFPVVLSPLNKDMGRPGERIGAVGEPEPVPLRAPAISLVANPARVTVGGMTQVAALALHADGKAAGGVQLSFGSSGAGDGGDFERYPSTATTDPNGKAAMGWIAGDTAGKATIAAAAVIDGLSVSGETHVDVTCAAQPALQNGGFEDWLGQVSPACWANGPVQNVTKSREAHSGAASVKGENGAVISQIVRVSPGLRYDFSWWTKTTFAGPDIVGTAKIEWLDPAFVAIGSPTTQSIMPFTSWTQYGPNAFLAPPTAAFARLGFASSTGHDLLVDDVVWTASGVTVVTLQPGPGSGKDSYVHAGSPAKNYGTDPTLFVTAGGRTYVEFDVSPIPSNAVVLSANLELFYWVMDHPGEPNAGVHEVTGPWDETAVTWNNQPPFAAVAQDVCPLGQEINVFVNWDVTGLVQRWVSLATANRGMVVKPAADPGPSLFAGFRSSDWGNASERPRLIVAYFTGRNQPPNTPAVPSGPASGNVGMSYSYSTSATDPDGDQVSYTFDWGDQTALTITPFVNSGAAATASHAWAAAGTYSVKAMATDAKGMGSKWSSAAAVVIASPPSGGFTIDLPHYHSFLMEIARPVRGKAGWIFARENDNVIVGSTLTGSRLADISNLTKDTLLSIADLGGVRDTGTPGARKLEIYATSNVVEWSLWYGPNSYSSGYVDPGKSTTIDLPHYHSFTVEISRPVGGKAGWVFARENDNIIVGSTLVGSRLADIGNSTRDTLLSLADLGGVRDTGTPGARKLEIYATSNVVEWSLWYGPNSYSSGYIEPGKTVTVDFPHYHSFTVEISRPVSNKAGWVFARENDNIIVGSTLVGGRLADIHNSTKDTLLSVADLGGVRDAGVPDAHKLEIYGTTSDVVEWSLWQGPDTYSSGAVSPSQPPSTPATPSGPTSGTPGASCSYSTSATDPDGDQVRYTFDWGDGQQATTGLVNSGVAASASHTWAAAGTYAVKVKATDSTGLASGWSNSLTVIITTPPGVTTIDFPHYHSFIVEIARPVSGKAGWVFARENDNVIVGGTLTGQKLANIGDTTKDKLLEIAGLGGVRDTGIAGARKLEIYSAGGVVEWSLWYGANSYSGDYVAVGKATTIDLPHYHSFIVEIARPASNKAAWIFARENDNVIVGCTLTGQKLANIGDTTKDKLLEIAGMGGVRDTGTAGAHKLELYSAGNVVEWSFWYGPSSYSNGEVLTTDPPDTIDFPHYHSFIVEIARPVSNKAAWILARENDNVIVGCTLTGQKLANMGDTTKDKLLEVAGLGGVRDTGTAGAHKLEIFTTTPGVGVEWSLWYGPGSYSDGYVSP